MSCRCGALREATVKLVSLSERHYFNGGRFLLKEFTVFQAGEKLPGNISSHSSYFEVLMSFLT